MNKKVDYLGIELDDLLIDLAASMAEVMDLQMGFVQGDAVRPQVLKESDIIVSDLPVGYYPEIRQPHVIKSRLRMNILMLIIC